MKFLEVLKSFFKERSPKPTRIRIVKSTDTENTWYYGDEQTKFGWLYISNSMSNSIEECEKKIANKFNEQELVVKEYDYLRREKT